MCQQSWLWRLLLLNELHQCSCRDLSSNILVHLGTSWYPLRSWQTYSSKKKYMAKRTWNYGPSKNGFRRPFSAGHDSTWPCSNIQSRALGPQFRVAQLFKGPATARRTEGLQRSLMLQISVALLIVCYGTSKQSLEVNHVQMGHGFHSYVKLSDGNLQLSAD
jgi:hypothetical protein